VFANVVRDAAVVVAGSTFMADSARALGLLRRGQRCEVVPYGVGAPRPAALPRPAYPPIRFAIVASVMPHKGIHTAVDAFRDIDPSAATLDVWGVTTALPAYVDGLRLTAGPAVRWRGIFPEADKDAVFFGAHVLVVPSLGLESFGLVVREAMIRGVPVLASRRGALVEAFEDGREGAFFAPGDAAAMRAHVLRLIERPAIIEDWVRALARVNVKDMDAHAAEISAIYDDVLRARQR
jgi:glycosyltransferase involved in cell wall biosynthesis